MRWRRKAWCLDTCGFIPKKIQWHIHAGPWSLVNWWHEALTRHYIRCSWILMWAAVSLVDWPRPWWWSVYPRNTPTLPFWDWRPLWNPGSATVSPLSWYQLNRNSCLSRFSNIYSLILCCFIKPVSMWTGGFYFHLNIIKFNIVNIVTARRQMKLREGNVFTPVYHSISASRYIIYIIAYFTWWGTPSSTPTWDLGTYFPTGTAI